MRAVALHSPNRMIRALAAIAAGLVIVQILLLQQPDYAGRLIGETSDKLVHFAVFGAIAFFFWIATGGRWPLLV